jgi:aspartyl-tRNA(Asn)/glutamyl-tRNA(Gln) amidotransferase subunit A
VRLHQNDIAALNAQFRFCEDFEVSAPLDFAQPATSGPLSDLRIGVKSNISVAGQAWTAGIGPRVDRSAPADAPVIASLRAAGAGVLSRLMMDEGALGAATDNPHFGRCENPAYPGHSAGGSSGGSAAAVAARAVDAALGTDTLGSVRIPAAYCGVYGLKLGAERVDMAGILPLAPGFDALGVMAQSPANIGRVLDVLDVDAGPGLTGWCMPLAATLDDCTPEIRAAMAHTARRLEGLFGPPAAGPVLDLPGLRGDAFLLTEHEAVDSLGAQPGLSAGLQKLIAYGRSLSPERLADVRGRIGVARETVIEALGTDRVLLMPTVAEPTFQHGTRPPVGQADFTGIANIAGLPALAIPMGGLPPVISLQLVGPARAERALLALAAQL